MVEQMRRERTIVRRSYRKTLLLQHLVKKRGESAAPGVTTRE
jgi:hypothetical protein